MVTRNQVDVGLSGQSGNGAFAGSIQPTLITPGISEIYDANGNIILNLFSNSAAVNNFAINNSSSGNPLIINNKGADTDIRSSVISKGTSRVNVKGVSTNTSPPAGYQGEFLTSVIPVGSAVSLTTNVVANITSFSLDPGDWDIWGALAFLPNAATSVTDIRGSSSIITQTINILSSSTNGNVKRMAAFVPGAVTFSIPFVQGRLNLSATTTVYLCARATFTISTMSCYGFLSARRAA